MASQYILYLTGTSADAAGARAALTLADKTGAHVEALFIQPDPSELIPFVGEGVPGSIVEDIIKTAAETADKAFAAAKNTVTAEAATAGLPVTADPGKGVSFETLQGPSLDVLTREVKLADLTIIPFGGEDLPRDIPVKIEHVLLQLRRPVLVARGNIAKALPGRVVVLWDGKLEAATAIQHALPLLAQASEVHVLHVRPTETDLTSAREIVDYLSRRGLKAEAHDVVQGPSPVSEVVFNKTFALSPDLVVMGGYGHSRLRELVLGGATRHFLAEAKCPLFLAH